MPERATRRLFIGLGLPGSIAESLVRQVAPTFADEHGRPLDGVRSSSSDDLHLTLCFLGNFPEDARAVLEGALGEELRGQRAPELCVRETGGFPDLVRPRVLWAAVAEKAGTEGRLSALRDRAQRAATLAGWRPPAAERGKPFRPHVTLARVRRSARRAVTIGPTFGRLAFDHRWSPDAVALFESRPRASVRRYHVLKTEPLVVGPG